MTALADPTAEPSAGRPGTGGRRQRLWLRVVVAVLLVAFGVALLVPVLTAGRIWWVARQDDVRAADAIVVLGASQYDGTPSPIFEARLRHALDLYLDGVAPIVVTLGGKQPGDRFTEAAAGRDWLTANGVAPDAVVAVEAGSTTYESLEAAAPVLAAQGRDDVVLVSDPWHAFRSREMALDLGLDAVGSPTRTGPVVQTRETQLRYILRETAAFLSYRASGPR